jgi:uncharacterized protein with HEPN domain
MSQDLDRLQDILDAIEKIERYSSKGRERFDSDELVQTWIIHHIQIIGEAARRVSVELKARHTDIPWSQIIGMRNILVHDYFGVDLEEVWSTAMRDIPDLKRKIEAILQELNITPKI